MNKGKPFTITKVRWFTETPGYNEPVERLHSRFRALISFLQENGLSTRTILTSDDPITDDLAIESTDLTDEGLQLMKNRYRKWLDKVDNGMAPDDVSMFQKELAKLREK